MIIEEHNGFVRIYKAGSFSAEQTFDSGQCFRWILQPDGSYLGIAFGRAARISSNENCITVSGSKNDAVSIWIPYLDLDLNYDSIRSGFAVDDFTKAAADFGRGIRILQQEPWEALCSFILSQCNNIPRIRSIITTLCRLFGKPFEYEGQPLYTFPSPQRIASLSLDELAPLRCGYRAPYLLDAARAVVDGELDFNTLRTLPTEEARKQLTKLNGVGVKVADCFLLYGLHRLDAFPVDTWMKKAAAFYAGDMAALQKSPYAGIYQQYIFYYARSQKL